MIKKVLNTAKATLLAATLLVTGLAALPQLARAWEIDIFCSGSSNLCASVYTDTTIYDFYFGDVVAIFFFPD
jgi:hypothetical protein